MKKFNLYLHIGSGKTGTTAIQSFCVTNNQLLNQHGYHYLESPRWGDNSHHLLGFALWGSAHLNLPNIPEVSLQSIEHSLSTELNGLPENIQNIIISTELLFELGGKPQMAPLNKFIKDHFKSVKVLCYLRRQDNYLVSLYQQWIKTNHKNVRGISIAEFVSKYKGNNYYETLRPWSVLFGKENIRVRVYEKSKFINGSIFDDFLFCIDITNTESFIPPPKSQTNHSINVEITEILNLCDFTTVDQLNEIIPEISVNTSSINLLSTEDRITILDRYKKSNKLVLKEFLSMNDGNLFEPIERLEDKANENPSFETLKQLTPKLIKKIISLQSEIKDLKQHQQKTTNEIFRLNKAGLSKINLGENTDLISKDGYLKINACTNDPSVFINPEFKPDNMYQVEITVDVPRNTKTQLFYMFLNSEVFTEKNSIILDSTTGINFHTFNLNFNNLSQKLRIDPGTHIGDYTFHSLKIFEL